VGSNRPEVRGRWVIYYYLVNSLKRRLILELKDSFKGHPVYNKIIPWIEDKFVFTERPQYGIVVKGSSGNKVSLAADNFMGTVQSHVMLAYIGTPTYALEWVREDLRAVAEDGYFPTAAGVYYMEILHAPERNDEHGWYILDPLLTVTDEAVLQFITGVEREAQLQNVPLKGTVRLWENHRILLTENVDYAVDYQNGGITLLRNFSANAVLNAFYRYPVASIGPIPFQWNQADFKTLPGVVLAFGKRACKGDKCAIVVYPDRVDAAQAYGGKFELTFELSVVSQDSIQREEIADFAIMSLWGIKKPLLEFEGIELIDISMGGEVEETYDEAADLMYYNSSLSLQIRADWEIHIPMPLTVSKVQPVTPRPEEQVAANLFFATFPVLAGRNSTFEKIQ
jgi:hypothetical protein